MAGRKKEGLDRIKDTTGGKRREDKQVIGRTSFDPLTVDAKNILTVIYLLQSPEENIQLRAIASLEIFGRKAPENLVLLSTLGIVEYVFTLLDHPDNVARRFTLKLIAMLSSLEEFRHQMLEKENVLNIFVDILKKESDLVLQEFSSLILAHLSSEYHVASELLKVEDCVETLLLRILSADPDIEKNCLDIMSHLLNDINGVEAFIETPTFEMKILLNLVSSNYPVIQKLVIEVLIQLTSWCRDTRVLFAFRDAIGIELILQVLETQEWADLHPGALDLLINITDSPELCEYLQQSGCLYRFICLLDNMGGSTMIEKILGVLARMSQTQRGREALYSVKMETRFTSFLELPNDNIQEASCLGIANLAQNILSLNRIVEANPIKSLLGIVNDGGKNLRFRNLAAYALNILANAEKKAAMALLQDEEYQGLFTILTDNSSLSTELCQNVIQVFIGISLYEELRTEIISENFISALMSCLPSGDVCVKKDPSLQVDVLECLSEYLVESEARLLLHQLNGAEVVLNCLRSKFASVREWAGHLVVVASQSTDFVKDFIERNGLEWMMKEKNTMYSMPSWQSAIETVFASYLPAKFAYTGRLDFEDVTQDGFYISMNPKAKFIILDHFVESLLSPISPVYVANFNVILTPEESKESSVASSQVSVHKTTEPQDLKKFMKGADRNSLEEYKWQGSLNSYLSVEYEEPAKFKNVLGMGKHMPDPCLNEYLDILKKKMRKEELAFGDLTWSRVHPRIVSNRARIIAEFVAEEMSGPEPHSACSAHYKTAYINEMKHTLGTNIIPLGLIRVGGYLERAMLFKVLADRTGLRCALVRGPYARAWIEICVPVISVEDSEESLRGKYCRSLSSEGSALYESESQYPGESRFMESDLGEEDFWFPKVCPGAFKGFPSNFLKPNALVDLIVQPGRIMCINSVEADEYRGDHLFQ